ncbi:translocation/assembly module TamB domain-containing protein [Gillisia sp. M10.2A]|uniref:Translocation/assembly module TamB domain-containing protein n=1 Tax=Gillisia lutea TaxID=2909668 RepID=A0ABS9EIP7_9FLAO|nr:translocation/assembly module TamB domain-containing protein [Gillisia lutea]MCF4102732.1 translocation/assembly module TamB domain-containing protein [Gillisia lutea]
MKHIFKKSLKIILWILGGLIALLLLIILLLQFPAVQNVVKKKAISFIEGKIQTPVKIESLEIGLPKKIVLKGFYFEDQNKDTLVAGDRLAIDISLFKLIRSNVEINSIELEGAVANISRDKDSVFNFDYIVKAFASPPPQDTTATTTISINTIDLDKIKFRFKDEISKNYIDLKLHHFDTHINRFDLDNMSFGIPDINIDGLYLEMEQRKLTEILNNSVNTSQTSSSEKPLELDLGDITLSNIGIYFKSEQAKMNADLFLNKLDLKFNELDLTKEFINLEKVNLKGFRGDISILKDEVKSVGKDTITNSSTPNWKVNLGTINSKDMAFSYVDENSKPIATGLDYGNLDFSNLNIDAKNIYYSLDSISGNVKTLSFQEKSGLQLKEFRTDFLYSDKSAYLKNLYLETPQTVIKDRIQIEYPSLASLQKNLEDLYVDANLENSKVAFSDILLLSPDLSKIPPFVSHPHAILQIDGKVEGKLSALNISKFEASGIGNTKIALAGTIQGLPDVESAVYNLHIRNFSSGAQDLNSFVPKGSIPSNIQLPKALSLTGNFKGTTKNFDTKLQLKSSSGNANIDAGIDLRKVDAEKYRGGVSMQELDLGKFISNDSIGKVSLSAKFNGIGFNPKSATASASGTLTKAVYNSYTYKDLNFNGTITQGDFDLSAKMQDPNIDFDVSAAGSFKEKYPKAIVTASLNNIALDSLKLYNHPLRFSGELKADLTTADPDFLNGKVILSKFIVTNGSKIYPLDSINLTATATADSSTINLRSQFLKAHLKGKYQLTKVGAALTSSFSKYYSINPPATSIDTISPQSFSFDLVLTNDPILQKLVPELMVQEPLSMNGRFNSVGDSIVINAELPRFKYLDYQVTNTAFSMIPKDEALTYDLNIADVDSPQLKIFNTALSGAIQNNTISYHLEIDDSKDQPHYRLAGNMQATKENSTQFSLDPESLLLNYKSWNIPADNTIAIAPTGVWANNFELSNNQNTIRINSPEKSGSAPLNIDFENFDIETISAMVSKDTLLAGGKINGQVVVHDLTSAVKFTSNLTVNDFNFKKDTIGNISLKVNNEVIDRLNADVSITGKGNQVNLSGVYNIADTGLNMDLAIEKLNLKSIQGFSFGGISESSGYLSGSLKLQGTTSKPAILGELKFNEIGFRVNQLNAYFQNINDALLFDEKGITLNNFKVFDEDTNKLNINGAVLTSDYLSYGFDLKVNSTNFKAMNSTAKDNELYYGDLFLDTDLKITGALEAPVITGNIAVDKDTKLTVVLPQQDPSIADREGIVEFIDEQSKLEADIKRLQEDLNSSELQGMDISVNIKVNKEAELTLIIDEGNGDFLNVKGDAELNAGIDLSGKTSLTGRYELDEGAYEMSFNFIRRKFEIEKGSYLLFLGEPTSAEVNITAFYTTQTAPIDLLDNQLGSVSPQVRNTYKQKLPFQTLLKMKGELLQPEISFDIKLPDGNYNVSTEIINNTNIKLAQLREQPSELNKQVFALLLLNRFIGEDPFSSEAGGGGAGAIARQSVSKILSQQLNDLASDLINGVELNFDLESTEDYTTGQLENKTDLNVGLSKQLLNDRLKVTIGSSFGLEGPQQTNQQANNIAGDIAVDYQLSKDGRYMLRAYRKNQYEVALQGQIIETGVAFIITMDYNKFKELFTKKKK